MDPKWQFLFYLAAIICWAIECMKIGSIERRYGAMRFAIFGWFLFGIPFAWNAWEAGW